MRARIDIEVAFEPGSQPIPEIYTLLKLYAADEALGMAVTRAARKVAVRHNTTAIRLPDRSAETIGT